MENVTHESKNTPINLSHHYVMENVRFLVWKRVRRLITPVLEGYVAILRIITGPD